MTIKLIARITGLLIAEIRHLTHLLVRTVSTTILSRYIFAKKKEKLIWQQSVTFISLFCCCMYTDGASKSLYSRAAGPSMGPY